MSESSGAVPDAPAVVGAEAVVGLDPASVAALTDASIPVEQTGSCLRRPSPSRAENGVCLHRVPHVRAREVLELRPCRRLPRPFAPCSVPRAARVMVQELSEADKNSIVEMPTGYETLLDRSKTWEDLRL